MTNASQRVPEGDEGPLTVTRVTSVVDLYHSRDDCPQIDRYEMQPRSESFVDWHDLSPCQACHSSEALDE
jgi:hypothetical protein